MSKSKNRKFDYYDDWEDVDDFYGTDPKDREKRKNKRLVNILRSKNIDELMNLEDEED